MELIYFDNNATTQPDPRVVEAMLPFLRDRYANPSSLYHAAQQVCYAVECAREQVAALVNAPPRRMLFTSGGTESNHLAIRGALAARPDRRHIITTAVEHDSIRRLCAQLQREGYEVTRFGVDEQGHLDLAQLEAAITPQTALLSVMHANNETGVIFPIGKIGAIAKQRGIPFHVDAAQTAGKIPIDVNTLPVDLLSFAAHKLHGPKGVGALYMAPGARLRAQLFGGHQEHGLRAGTENVPGIVGFGVAAELAAQHLSEEAGRVRELRDRLESGILTHVPYARLIPSPSKGEGRGEGDHLDPPHRLPNTTCIGFASLEAEAILILLSNQGICASSGSACSSGSLEPSHVLTAMGIDRALIHGAIRLSLSRFNTAEEIDHVLDVLPSLLKRLEPLAAHPIVPS